MPMISVSGLGSVSEEQVSQLRREVVLQTSEQHDCPLDWVRVFFPADRLENPAHESEGSGLVYIQMNTSLLADKPDADEQAKAITQKVAQTVWDSFSGEREVEMVISPLNPKWMQFLEAAPK